MTNNFIFEKPTFSYAVTQEVIDRCPFTLEGKEIMVEDFVPTRAREKDTGYDCRCAETNEIFVNGEYITGMELYPGCYFKMNLGFRMFAPNGWWLSLAPRSGTFLKKYIHALYGVIDETFENQMCFVGQFMPNACDLIDSSKRYIIPFGYRIAQVIVVPRYDQNVSIISNDEIDKRYKDRNDPRGTGGFNSSGNV